jgi:hypothetical protein
MREWRESQVVLEKAGERLALVTAAGLDNPVLRELAQPSSEAPRPGWPR